MSSSAAAAAETITATTDNAEEAAEAEAVTTTKKRQLADTVINNNINATTATTATTNDDKTNENESQLPPTKRPTISTTPVPIKPKPQSQQQKDIMDNPYATINNFSDKDNNKQLRDQTSLRYISKRVSSIVERKQTTNYNEVANELVDEITPLLDVRDLTERERANHEKNVRRRVYDALNVLLATGIISKTKDKDNKDKVIQWKAFPVRASNELVVLDNERQEIMKEVERKKKSLLELLIQNVCFFNLNQRNLQSSESDSHKKSDNGTSHGNDDNMSDGKIHLPFIVVNTSEKANIQCEMNREKTDVMFNFNMPFEINDDNEILKRLGL